VVAALPNIGGPSVQRRKVAKLLLPFLSSKAKVLISRLNVQELDDYRGVRDFIL